MSRWSALALLLVIAAGALALRAPNLGVRPLHNDEAVNAVKVTELWGHGEYRYDPHEYHGPTLHYATLPVLWLSGANHSAEIRDAVLRVAPVIFGVGLILLLPLFSDGLGRQATVWAALFTAISPAMVFYSRYFIHEMLLVAFTALTIGSGWRYVQSRSPFWAALTGAGVGLMFATKETFVLAIAAMVIALAIAALATRRMPNGDWRMENGTISNPDSSSRNWKWRHVTLAIGAALLVWFVFFSSFFANFAGLLDSVRTYVPWLKRAGGESPHIHPWYFYLERLAWFHPAKSPLWSEGLILVLAAVGFVVSVWIRPTALRRFFALYTLLLTAIYSAISYKTPWCLLGFFHGMIFLAGIGAATLVEWFRSRVGKTLVIAVIVALASQLGWQAWRGSFVYAADRRNPYVYAQTLPSIFELVERIEGIARVAPTGHKTIIKVAAPDHEYWPLPWYLRHFEHVGWYEKLPDDAFAPMMIVASEFNARLDDKSNRDWLMVGITELRPGKFLELYVEFNLWSRYVETLPREEE